MPQPHRPRGGKAPDLPRRLLLLRTSDRAIQAGGECGTADAGAADCRSGFWGLLGTVQLPPEAKSLLDTIKADKMAALKLGDFVKVLPKIPGYVKSATTVGKLITSGAKSRDVKGAKDANKALGDL